MLKLSPKLYIVKLKSLTVYRYPIFILWIRIVQHGSSFANITFMNERGEDIQTPDDITIFNVVSGKQKEKTPGVAIDTYVLHWLHSDTKIRRHSSWDTLDPGLQTSCIEFNICKFSFISKCLTQRLLMRIFWILMTIILSAV
jgi:hypothetical protein